MFIYRRRMADKNELGFDDNFLDLPDISQNLPRQLRTAPKDPLHTLIDSDRYIKSLETKLKKLQGKTGKEPTAKEMISSLEKSKEEQFRKMDSMHDEYVSNFVQDSSDLDNSYSFLQRKVHPDRIAIDPEELVELLKDDDIGKRTEECATADSDHTKTVGEKNKGNSVDHKITDESTSTSQPG